MEDKCGNADSSTSSSNSNPFLYAQVVLGAYHANMLYTEPGLQNYEAWCFDFLWVHWYELVDPVTSGWSSSKLNTICFPPIHQANSFGFVDPKDILHWCHIIPAFAKGKLHTNEVGISCFAKDHNDQMLYYIGWCVRSSSDLATLLTEIMKFLGFLIRTWLCIIIRDWALVIFMPTSPVP